MTGAPYYTYRREMTSNRDISLAALRTFCLGRGWELSVSPYDDDMGFTITVEGKTKAPRMALLPYLGGGSYSSDRRYRFAFWEYETEKRGKSLVITMTLRDKERLAPLGEDLLDTFRMSVFNHPFFIDYCREEKPFVDHTKEELVWKAMTAPERISLSGDHLRKIAYSYYLYLTDNADKVDVGGAFPSLY